MAKYLCPVCRSPLHKALHGRLAGVTHLQIFLLTVAISGGLYFLQGWEGGVKGAFFYLPLWGLAEFIHWVSVRDAARCGTCDFDPMLYKRDWRAARQRVENRMNRLSGELQEKIREKVRVMEDASNARAALAEKTSPPPPSA